MLPRIVLHKTNGHRHAPESARQSLGDILRLVHAARDHSAPAATTLRFAHTVGNETATSLVQQVSTEIDALRLGLTASLVETEAAFARGELADVHTALDEAKNHADLVGRLIARLVSTLADAPVDRRLVNLNALVRRCAGRLRDRIGSDVLVRTHLAARLGGVVAHPRRLEDALLVMMSPPRSDAPVDRQSVKIQTLRGSRLTSDEATLVVRVTHRPVGLGKHALAAVAAAPWALAAADESAVDVYLARQLVHQHGGALAAENLPDGGARFTLELPAVS